MLLNRNTYNQKEEILSPDSSLEVTKRRINRFGIQAVTQAAGLKSTQTVLLYLEGIKVRPKTEQAILTALNTLEKEACYRRNGINTTINRRKDPDATWQVVPMHLYMELLELVEDLQRKVDLLTESQLAAHQWVDLATAAQILKCSKMTLYRKKERRELPFRQDGRKIMFNVYDLANYLESKRIHPDTIQQRIFSQLGAA